MVGGALDPDRTGTTARGCSSQSDAANADIGISVTASRHNASLSGIGPDSMSNESCRNCPPISVTSKSG